MAKLKVNLTGVDSGRVCPPDGLYEAVVVAMEDDKPTNGKDPRLVIRSEIINADDERYNGYPLWSYFPYDKGTKTWSKESPSAWKVVQMLLALYGTEKVTIDTDNPPEEPFRFKGKVEEYKGENRLKLDTWLPVEEMDEPDEDEDEPEDEVDVEDEDDEDEDDDEASDEADEDEEEDEEPEPVPAKSRRTKAAAAAAPAAKTRKAKAAPEPEPEEEEDDEVPDYPEWTTDELEGEIKVRKLQLTLPRADKAKRKAMIDALNEDDAAAEDPLA
jgi:hypothetical protein